MALIKCKECGNEISSSANVCPHCGIKVSITKCPECGAKVSDDLNKNATLYSDLTSHDLVIDNISYVKLNSYLNIKDE